MYQRYWERLNVTEMAGEQAAWLWVTAGLFLVGFVLIVVLWGVQNHTVRIYNWNGKRYCYLGRAGLRRESDGYRVRISERLADLSYTTLYQICPSRGFVRRNRYRRMVLLAGDAQGVLHVDGCMRQSLYYRKALQRMGNVDIDNR